MRLIVLLLFLSSCTFDYTVAIKSHGKWNVHHLEAKKNAHFWIDYDRGYTLKYYSDFSFAPVKSIGKDVSDFEVLNIKKK